MRLSELINLVDKMEFEMGWDVTTKEEIIGFIKQDARLLSNDNISHKGVDLFIELLQLIKRTNINLDNEIPKALIAIERRYKAGHVKNVN